MEPIIVPLYEGEPEVWRATRFIVNRDGPFPDIINVDVENFENAIEHLPPGIDGGTVWKCDPEQGIGCSDKYLPALIAALSKFVEEKK